MNIFICDPICVKESGHNLTAAIRYDRLLCDTFELGEQNVRLLVSNNLKFEEIGWIDESLGMRIDRVFSHYYPNLIPVNGCSEELIDRHGEYMSDLAYKELCNIIDKYVNSTKDVLYYPSIDYFSLKSIIRFINNNSGMKIPTFIIRFIGVMEYHNYECEETLDSLLLELSRVISNNIFLSAESTILASYIENIVGVDVSTTPTLVSSNLLPYPKNNLFTIVFPGSARRDKGFDRISDILDIMNSNYSEMRYQVFVQSLPPEELKYFFDSLHALAKIPNVVIYPQSVGDQKMKEMFLVADLVVAPYDSRVYEYRSSAIMAESAIYGRPIVASHDCGFSSEIEAFNLGMLASNNQDFAEKIHKFYQLDRKERADFGVRANLAFSRYTDSSYKKLFSVL